MLEGINFKSFLSTDDEWHYFIGGMATAIVGKAILSKIADIWRRE